jgi:hypothetical protein
MALQHGKNQRASHDGRGACSHQRRKALLPILAWRSISDGAEAEFSWESDAHGSDLTAKDQGRQGMSGFMNDFAGTRTYGK